MPRSGTALVGVANSDPPGNSYATGGIKLRVTVEGDPDIKGVNINQPKDSNAPGGIKIRGTVEGDPDTKVVGTTTETVLEEKDRTDIGDLVVLDTIGKYQEKHQ